MSDKAKIAEALTIGATILENHGKTFDIPTILNFYERILSPVYSGQQVLDALDKHFINSKEFPMPSHVSDIINPPEPKITTAEYIAAKEWQKRNQNWSRFEPEAILIAAFEKQNSEARTEYERTQKALATAANSRNLDYDNDDLQIEGY